MSLDLQELIDDTLEKYISYDNIILSNNFILALVITFTILLIFYFYSKDDIDTIYADSNIYEITTKSTIVSTFIVYGLLYFNNKIITNQTKKKYENNEDSVVLTEVTNKKNDGNNILPVLNKKV